MAEISERSQKVLAEVEAFVERAIKLSPRKQTELLTACQTSKQTFAQAMADLGKSPLHEGNSALSLSLAIKYRYGRLQVAHLTTWV